MLVIYYKVSILSIGLYFTSSYRFIFENLSYRISTQNIILVIFLLHKFTASMEGISLFKIEKRDSAHTQGRTTNAMKLFFFIFLMDSLLRGGRGIWVTVCPLRKKVFFSFFFSFFLLFFKICSLVEKLNILCLRRHIQILIL